MTLRGTTPVSNEFFDKRMADLSASAIRVYLKIVRNTWGWRDQNGKIKERDWISHSQFGNVGVSSRSVTKAVEELLGFGMIRVTDDHGNSLSDPNKRKHTKRIFYAPIAHNTAERAYNNEKNDQNKAESSPKPPQNLLSTKAISLQKYRAENTQGSERVSDGQRISQIMEEEQRKQIKRDGWLYK